MQRDFSYKCDHASNDPKLLGLHVVKMMRETCNRGYHANAWAKCVIVPSAAGAGRGGYLNF